MPFPGYAFLHAGMPSVKDRAQDPDTQFNDVCPLISPSGPESHQISSHE